MENWKIIPESEHEVSDQGRVRNSRTGRILKPRRHSNGYLRAQLGASREEYIHRLVCAAFNGPCPDGYQCDHLNHKRDDNRACNLRWITPDANRARRQCPKGEKSPRAKLTAIEVKGIRDLLPSHSNIAIGQRFGVHRRTIADIRNGVTWK